MKFVIPTNWENALLDAIPHDTVEELYGALAYDPVGGGRPSFMLPHISRGRFKRHVKEVRDKGYRFNYLLNAVCLDNREFTRAGQRKIRHFLQWLIDSGVESVTVSIPYLLELIKHNYPTLTVSVSTMAGVDSLVRARYWESLGADKITLATTSSVIRNFPLLRLLKKQLRCEIQLIANLTCLSECPFWQYHAVSHAHASQSGHPSGGFLIDYCFLRCNYIKLCDPGEFIYSAWIRPEDVGYYEEIGIDSIKFANRPLSTSHVEKMLVSYSQRQYEGNLLALFQERTSEGKISRGKTPFLQTFRYFFRPQAVNIFKFATMQSLRDASGISVDNASLDGFLAHWLMVHPQGLSGEHCPDCQNFIARALRIDQAQRKKMLDCYARYLQSIVSGDMFSYRKEKR
ncbi:MAG: U32 family peptidase [Candidatus Omnitrophica bacterium]|nr:U32 family peptidase [Candidatus Omnitrophota bacterium]